MTNELTSQPTWRFWEVSRSQAMILSFIMRSFYHRVCRLNSAIAALVSHCMDNCNHRLWRRISVPAWWRTEWMGPEARRGGSDQTWWPSNNVIKLIYVVRYQTGNQQFSHMMIYQGSWMLMKMSKLSVTNSSYSSIYDVPGTDGSVATFGRSVLHTPSRKIQGDFSV